MALLRFHTLNPPRTTSDIGEGQAGKGCRAISQAEAIRRLLYWTSGGGSSVETVVIVRSGTLLIERRHADPRIRLVTIAALVALPNPPIGTAPAPWTPRRPSYVPNGAASPNPAAQQRVPTKFVMLMSDGRAYLVSWAPPTTEHTPKLPTSKRRISSTIPEGRTADVLFDEKAAEEEQMGQQKWSWEGVCFHPMRELEGEEGELAQEKELDKGVGGSTLGLNDKMGLIAVGCEE